MEWLRWLAALLGLNVALFSGWVAIGLTRTPGGEGYSAAFFVAMLGLLGATIAVGRGSLSAAVAIAVAGVVEGLLMEAWHLYSPWPIPTYALAGGTIAVAEIIIAAVLLWHRR
jgi:hypothetical protein